ncbi:hypothetical protein FPSE5266_00242 [Fusarium pseudograminearum]|nr:hypothetical protein FPSE5266_00242 [Fusarium pseudograminearum]
MSHHLLCTILGCSLEPLKATVKSVKSKVSHGMDDQAYVRTCLEVFLEDLNRMADFCDMFIGLREKKVKAETAAAATTETAPETAPETALKTAPRTTPKTAPGPAAPGPAAPLKKALLKTSAKGKVGPRGPAKASRASAQGSKAGLRKGTRTASGARLAQELSTTELTQLASDVAKPGEPVKEEPVKDEPVKNEPVKDEPAKSDEPVKSGEQAKSVNVEKRRNEKEKTKALERDHKMCIFISTINPDVAHVLPFSTTSSTENTARTNRLWPATVMLLDQKFHDQHLQSLVLGGLDKAYNMQSTATQLHRCGLKWSVRVKFHWFPDLHNKSRYEKEANLEGPVNTVSLLLEDLDNAHAHLLPARRPSKGFVRAFFPHGEWLVSGTISYVNFDNPEDAMAYHGLIKLQWAALRIQMMRAGAEPLDLPTGDDDDDDGYPVYGSLKKSESNSPVAALAAIPPSDLDPSPATGLPSFPTLDLLSAPAPAPAPASGPDPTPALIIFPTPKLNPAPALAPVPLLTTAPTSSIPPALTAIPAPDLPLSSLPIPTVSANRARPSFIPVRKDARAGSPDLPDLPLTIRKGKARQSEIPPQQKPRMPSAWPRMPSGFSWRPEEATKTSSDKEVGKVVGEATEAKAEQIKLHGDENVKPSA